jgi:hydroxymethylglutaryl-CoA lyase
MGTPYRLPKKVTLSDLTVRDGFQSEQRVIPAEGKLFIIKQLLDAGFKEMEVAAFAPPRFQPQFRNWEEVVKGLPDLEDVTYSYVTTGKKATERAIAAREKGYRIDRILLGVLPASEKFNKTVLGLNYEDTWKWVTETVKAAHQLDMKVNVFLTGIFCPPDKEEGAVNLVERALEFIDRLLEIGIDDIEHPDHLGEATPDKTYEYFERVFEKYPDPRLHIFHIHDSRGMGLACYLAAMHMGVTRFEATLGGLGGWPANFVDGIPVPGLIGLEEVSRRPGLVSTEDFLVMLDAMGIETGIDLEKILKLGRMVERIVGRELWSMCLGTADRPGSGPLPRAQDYRTDKR